MLIDYGEVIRFAEGKSSALQGEGHYISEVEDNRWLAFNVGKDFFWSEVFHTRRTALRWLEGKWVLNINNQLCDGSTGERILDIAEKVRKGSALNG